MIKIEFPADDKRAAKAFGEALLVLAGYESAGATTAVNNSTEYKATEEDHTLAGPKADDGRVPKYDEPNEPPKEYPGGLFDGSADGADSEGLTDSGDNQTGSPADVDEKGVKFNPVLCAKAAEPFYGEGNARAGQWKKARKVDWAVYDKWYLEELGKSANTAEVQETTTYSESEGASAPPYDTSAAFGGAQTQAAEQAPTTAGDLMTWVSAKQADGSLTQEQFMAAFPKVGLQMGDLFAGDAAVIAMNVSKVYAELIK